MSVVTLLVAAFLASGCGSGSGARPLSVRAALALCAHPHATGRTVTVAGYFREGPATNGPIKLWGGLFDHDSVPAIAAESLAFLHGYRGLGFGINLASPLAASPVLDRIRDRTRLAVTVKLQCQGWSQPTSIRILRASGPSH